MIIADGVIWIRIVALKGRLVSAQLEKHFYLTAFLAPAVHEVNDVGPSVGRREKVLLLSRTTVGK